MIHGSIESRAAVIDYLQKLERCEVSKETLSERAEKSADGEYSPWRKVKDEPRVLAMSDGEGVIFALERPDLQGNARYSLIEASADKGGSKLHIMRDDNNKRSEEHTSELQSLMRISYAVFCLKKKNI